MRGLESLLKRWPGIASLGAGRLVDVLSNHVTTKARCPAAQLVQLVLHVPHAIVPAHPRVERDLHAVLLHAEEGGPCTAPIERGVTARPTVIGHGAKRLTLSPHDRGVPRRADQIQNKRLGPSR